MARIDTLEADFQPICRKILEQLKAKTGLDWAIIQGRRTIAYQNSLFNQPYDGKDNDGDGKIDEADEKVTGAKGGQSPHNYGLAADFVPIKNGTEWWNAPEKHWIALCEIAEGLGMTSGYRFNIKGVGKDRPHVEHPRWREQRALWQAGKVKVA